MWFASFFTLARFAGEGRVRDHTKDANFGKEGDLISSLTFVPFGAPGEAWLI